jgi:hypothetical protein
VTSKPVTQVSCGVHDGVAGRVILQEEWNGRAGIEQDVRATAVPRASRSTAGRQGGARGSSRP